MVNPRSYLYSELVEYHLKCPPINGIGVNIDPIDVPANPLLSLSRKNFLSIGSLLPLNASSSVCVSSTVTFESNWIVFLMRSSSDMGIRAMHCSSPPKPLNCDKVFGGASNSVAAIISVVTMPMKINKYIWSRWQRYFMCWMFSRHRTPHHSNANKQLDFQSSGSATIEFNLIYYFDTNNVRTSGGTEPGASSPSSIRTDKFISTEKWF